MSDATVKRTDDFLTRLEATLYDQVQGAAKGLQDGLRLTVAQARMNLGDDAGGQLAGSITASVEECPGQIVGRVSVGAAYGAYVEFGTGTPGRRGAPAGAPGAAAYKARARPVPQSTRQAHKGKRYQIKTGKSVMRGGAYGWVYKDPRTGKFVHAYGQQARPYLYPAMQTTRDLVMAKVKRGIQDALKV